MYIVHVHIHVKGEYIDAFQQATIENAMHSVKEPGVARFDFIQQSDEPTRFILVEVYRTLADARKHKETTHYVKWRDTVAEMMSEPRQGVKYNHIFPGDEGWG